MKKIPQFAIWLLALFSLQSIAGQDVDGAKRQHAGFRKASQGTNSYVDLTETSLQKNSNLLDCKLQLNTSPSGHRLNFKDGYVDIPPSAVRRYSEGNVFVSIKGTVSGIPATGLWIRTDSPNQQLVTCRRENVGCTAPVAYVLLLQDKDTAAYKKLLSFYPREQIFAGSMKNNDNGDVHPGAIMMTDRPGLHSPSMDGLSGPDDRRTTSLHFVCGTSVKYFDQSN